jgi:ParB family chromosome partitioning protein
MVLGRLAAGRLAMSSEVRGLGRGLGALLGAELSVSPSRGGGTLPVSLMRPGAFQPRRDIQQEPLEELAASIKANGVLQPIVIRPLPAGPRDGARYEIIAGERRWQAAKLAGLKDIPAIVRDLSDREAALVALIENIQREELTSAEEARAFKRLVEEFSLTHQEIAELVGRSRAAVTNLMRLLELPPEIVALIDERALAMGHARALLGLESDADRLRLGQLVAARECSVRETEQLVRKALEAQDDSAGEPVAPVVSELLKTKSLHVHLHQRAAGSGKLIVKFADLESRDALVAAIRQIAEL